MPHLSSLVPFHYKLNISIYLSLDKYKYIKLIQFCISYFGSYLALKTLRILISWLLQNLKLADLYLHCLQEKPADQDPYCLLELISDFFILFSKKHERYKLISSFGQVKFSMDKYIMAINLYLDK